MLRSLILFFLRVLRMVFSSGAPRSAVKQTEAGLGRGHTTHKASDDSVPPRLPITAPESPSATRRLPEAIVNRATPPEQQQTPHARTGLPSEVVGELSGMIDGSEMPPVSRANHGDFAVERSNDVIERAKGDRVAVETSSPPVRGTQTRAHELESGREVTSASAGEDAPVLAASSLLVEERGASTSEFANEAQLPEASKTGLVRDSDRFDLDDRLGDVPGTDFPSKAEVSESIRGARPVVARSSALPRTRLREVTTESFDGLVTPVSDAYSIWNGAIIDLSIQHSGPGDEIYLSITPSVLAAALGGRESICLSADDITAQFVQAVGEMYRSRVLPHPRKLETLRRCGSDGVPECVAFIALSVLAAYRMHTDEDTAANAYYRRLEELLGCGLSTTGMPAGFDGDDFYSLWAFLGAWLLREHGRRLAMPNENAGPRRFLALPLTHVPLRKVDIERLPAFFDWAGYAPGENVTSSTLYSALLQWVRSYGGFTRAGNDALADDRRSAVLAQVAKELTSWDGSSTDVHGRRTAAVEIYLHWRRRTPILSYLPRRPVVFPATFDDGEHMLDAGQDGWYEPSVINADGSELLNGFSWETSVGGLTFALRRHGSEAIAMAPSEFAGPISHGALVMGAPGAVVCANSVLPQVTPYLERITGRRCTPQPAPGIRSGWTLITDVRPVRRESPPQGLESLVIESTVEIIAAGGLRLGNRRAWMADAPPRVIVTGYEPGDEVRLDDTRMSVDESGAIVDQGLLARPGSHEIHVGLGARYRLDIVKPQVPADLSEPAKQGDLAQQYAVALPGGCWTIIGSRQSDVAINAGDRTQRSFLVACGFRPVWAISVSTSGAVVRRLMSPPAPPASFVRRSISFALWPWANAIYAAHVRHPHFQSEAGAPESVDPTWIAYTQAAKSIKRALKAASR